MPKISLFFSNAKKLELLFASFLLILASFVPASSHIDPNDASHNHSKLEPGEFNDRLQNEGLNDLGPGDSISQDPHSIIESALKSVMIRWNIPNATLAIALDDRLVYAQQIRSDFVDDTEPIFNNVRGRIASLSKAVTGAAILTLIADGRLSLDTLAFQLLPDLGNDLDDRLSNITIRHLLRHTGGWSSNDNFSAFFDPTVVGAPGASPETIIRWVRENTMLESAPGSTYLYSNIGYSVLGRIIERVSGQSYEQYVKENVLESAGISRMELGHSPPVNDDEFIYHTNEETHLELYDAAGGWVASAPDLLRFLTDIEYGELRDSFNDFEEACEDGESPCYRFGWYLNERGKRSHSGSLTGTRSYMEWNPDDQLSWAIIFNKRPHDSDLFLSEVKSSLNATIRSIPTWPEGDLFDSLP